MDQNQHISNMAYGWKVGLLCLLLLGAAGLVHSFDSGTETPIDVPLEYFPKEIGQWKASTDIGLMDSVAAMLGVDDYAFRDYISPQGRNVNFYASYYSSISQGKGYHSPLNCMPGSGWDISSTERVQIELPDGRLVQVRKMLLVRGSEYQVSLYWYQGRSRIVASEYWDLAYRLMDTIRYKRTDGAFVRLIASGSGDDPAALTELKNFAALAIPLLEEHFPGI